MVMEKSEKKGRRGLSLLSMDAQAARAKETAKIMELEEIGSLPVRICNRESLLPQVILVHRFCIDIVAVGIVEGIIGLSCIHALNG